MSRAKTVYGLLIVFVMLALPGCVAYVPEGPGYYSAPVVVAPGYYGGYRGGWGGGYHGWRH